jgi:very-short-patch-repair endonuclease
MSLPEALLWRELKQSDLHFRKQHPAGRHVLDFFCARANLAIEIDGIAHDMGDQPQCDSERDAWLRGRRIDTVRVPAREVLRDPREVAGSIVALVNERLKQFGKVAAPPSSLRDATSPSQVDEEDLPR